MLELSNNIIDEEDSSLGCEHTHRDIVQAQCTSTILPNFNVLSLAINGLYLLVFGQGRDRIFGFQVFIVKDVLSLVRYSKVD